MTVRKSALMFHWILTSLIHSFYYVKLVLFLIYNFSIAFSLEFFDHHMHFSFISPHHFHLISFNFTLLPVLSSHTIRTCDICLKLL